MTKNTSNSSYEEMIQTIQQQNRTLEKKVGSLRRTNILTGSAAISIALVAPIVAVNWAVISAAIVTAAPMIGIVVASLGAMLAVIGMSALVYKNRTAIKESAEKGLKNTKDGIVYAANRTIDGAGLLAKKTVDGAVYTKNQVQNAAAKVTEGVGSTFKKIGKGIEKTGRKLSNAGQDVKDAGSSISRSGSFNLTNRIIKEEDRKKFNDVKELLQEELSQSKNKKDTAQGILAEISSVVAKKMEDLHGKEDCTRKDLDRIGTLQTQSEYIEGLNHKSLKKKLSSKKVDPQLCEIFSQHSDEIKGIIKKSCSVDDSIDRSIDKAVEQNITQNTSSQPKTVAPPKPPRLNPALINVQNRSDSLSSIPSGYISDDNQASFEAEFLKNRNDSSSKIGLATSSRSNSLDSEVASSGDRSNDEHSSNLFNCEEEMNNLGGEIESELKALARGTTSLSRSSSVDGFTSCKSFKGNTQPNLSRSNSLDSEVASSGDRSNDEHSSNLFNCEEEMNNLIDELNNLGGEIESELKALARGTTSLSRSSSVDSFTSCKSFKGNTQPNLSRSNSLDSGVDSNNDRSNSEVASSSDRSNDDHFSNSFKFEDEMNSVMSKLKDLARKTTLLSRSNSVDSMDSFKSCNSDTDLTRSSSFGSFKNGFSPEQLEVKDGHKVEFPNNTKETDSGMGSNTPSSCSSDENLVRSSSSDLSKKTKITRSASCNNLNGASQDFSRSRSSSLPSVSGGFGLPTHILLTKKDGSMKSQADLTKTGSLEKLIGSQIDSINDVTLHTDEHGRM